MQVFIYLCAKKADRGRGVYVKVTETFEHVCKNNCNVATIKILRLGLGLFSYFLIPCLKIGLCLSNCRRNRIPTTSFFLAWRIRSELFPAPHPSIDTTLLVWHVRNSCKGPRTSLSVLGHRATYLPHQSRRWFDLEFSTGTANIRIPDTWIRDTLIPMGHNICYSSMTYNL